MAPPGVGKPSSGGWWEVKKQTLTWEEKIALEKIDKLITSSNEGKFQSP